ncbi:MAG: hypothetical protein Q4F97_07110 [Bacteroidales bacterium]|nr:hypothetical protein [Bacteroidales bacterium]
MKKLSLVILLSLMYLGVFAQIGINTEISYGFKLSNTDYSNVRIEFSPGYNLNNNMFLGLGAGYIYMLKEADYFNMSKKNYNMGAIPLYAHIKYSPWGKYSNMPFISFKAGYVFINKNHEYTSDKINMSTKYNGSVYLSPTLGWNFNLNKNNISLGINYNLIGCRIKNSEKNNYIKDLKSNENSSTIGVSVGFEF